MTLLPSIPRPGDRPVLLPSPREWRHTRVSLGVAGTLATSLIVVAGGRVGPIAGTRRISSWLGLLVPHGVNPVTDPLPGLVLIAGVVSLVVVWLMTVRALRSSALTLRSTWVLAACWALPLLIGPPLMSGDVLTYVAQGLLVTRHLNPYQVGPSALGQIPASLVDPRWRSAPSPYGPLATALQWASVEIGGTALGAVVVLRAVASLSVLAIGIFATNLAPRRHRPAVLVLTVLNPVVLLQVVSAEHIEGIMVALLLGAFLLHRRGHPYLALVAATAAADVKAPAMVAVGVIALATVVDAPARRVLTALRCAFTGGVSLLVLGMIVPDGWGWVHTALTTPAEGHTPAAPTSWLDIGLSPLLVLTHVMSGAGLVGACRDVGLLGAAAICIWLLLTIRRRPAIVTGGAAMLVVGLLGPVYYSWYGLWGGECLAAEVRHRRRDWLVMMTACSATMSIPGLATATVWIFGCVVGVLALAWAVRDVLRHGLPGRPAPVTRLAVAAAASR